MSDAQRRGLRSVVLKALNRNQILVLSNADGYIRITSLLQELSARYGIPISTLKLNAKILKELGLLEFNGLPAETTPSGKLVLRLINSGNGDNR